MDDPALLRGLAGLVYSGVAALAWRASATDELSERKLWLGISAALLLFGIAKALNLQEGLLDAVRGLAKHQGWYAWHQQIQLLFVIGMALVVVSFGALVSRSAPLRQGSVRLAAVVTLLLAIFILIRAASIHVIDELVVMDAGGIRAGWWVELAALFAIAAAASLFIRRSANL